MPARLGDDVDDFCIKCKRLTNHVVVSLVGDDPAKVRCRTCHSDHDYRREQAPPPKVDPRKLALAAQKLAAAEAAKLAAEGALPVAEMALEEGAMGLVAVGEVASEEKVPVE